MGDHPVLPGSPPTLLALKSCGSSGFASLAFAHSTSATFWLAYARQNVAGLYRYVQVSLGNYLNKVYAPSMAHKTKLRNIIMINNNSKLLIVIISLISFLVAVGIILKQQYKPLHAIEISKEFIFLLNERKVESAYKLVDQNSWNDINLFKEDGDIKTIMDEKGEIILNSVNPYQSNWNKIKKIIFDGRNDILKVDLDYSLNVNTN